MKEILNLIRKNVDKARRSEYSGEFAHGVVYTIKTKKGTVIFDDVYREGLFFHKCASISIKNGNTIKKIFKPQIKSLGYSSTRTEQDMMQFWDDLRTVCSDAYTESLKYKNDMKLRLVEKEIESLLD